MPGTASARFALLAFVLLVGGDPIHAQHRPEPSRFHQETLTVGTLDEPTEMAVADDGRIFVAERKGALKLYDPRTGIIRLIEQLGVDTHSENGLIGLTLDPRFDENGWLYLNYSVEGALKHRVARFSFTGEGIADERVLIEVPFEEGCCHTGGSMTFDERGNLYVSFGDNTNPFDAGSYAPIDPTPGREKMDARRSSANTQDFRGKILRITPKQNGTYSIPDGNLFDDPDIGRPEIYTMGHRNPYRISVDRRTGFLYWGEVGPDARVDSTLGPKGYDEVNQARGPGNFGWPLFIADNKPYREFNFTTGRRGRLFDPDRPVNDSPNNTGDRVLPRAQPAMIFYPYDVSPEFPPVGEGGRNAMAGPVYYAGDFEGPLRLPEYYDGKFIHYDWMRGWMMAVTMDDDGDFVSMEPFLDQFEFDHPIDVEMGPDGSLYVLEYGTYWHARNENSRLSRITYHRSNRPPAAHIHASTTAGGAPLTVTFSGEQSSDPDEGDVLSFEWRIEERGASGPTVTHTFTEPGTYRVRLTVRDDDGASAQANQPISVGNTAPEVRIALGGNRSFFWVDEPLDYRVQVTDAEDGRLDEDISSEDVHVAFDYVPGGVQPGHRARPEGLRLIESGDCAACHGVDEVSVGPSYRRVAQRYSSEDAPRLIEKIIQGGGGAWGDRPMAAHPHLARDDVEKMVDYILSLDEPGLPTAGTLRFQHEDELGAYVLTAAYEDVPRHGIGPLRTEEQVVLRPPVLTVVDAADIHLIGPEDASYPDGIVRPMATVYGDGAYLRFPDLDLTNVGRVRADFRAERHDFSVEIRSGSPDGRLLAGKDVEPPEQGEWFEEELSMEAAGTHDLYVVLRSDAQGLGQFNRMVRLGRLRFERLPDGMGIFVAPDGDDQGEGTLEDPFATIRRARDAVRSLPRTNPITVYLRGGRYELTEPLVFTPEDSGTEDAPVTYRAYEEERPVLSGGRIISGWRDEDGIWTIDLPEVRSGEWTFRQLYVDGDRRQRARIPNEGFLRVSHFPENDTARHYHDEVQSFGYALGDLDPAWRNLRDIEVIVYHFWTDSHLPIESIDTEKRIVTFRHAAGKVFTDDFSDEGARYVVENVYEGMDRPGEWYLNRRTGVLSYRPMEGEEPGAVEIVAPVAPAFIRMEGRPMDRQYVEHLSFRGLTFRYTNWDLPPGNSNDRQGSASVPAAVTLRGAQHITFEGNTIENLGTFAFEIEDGSSENSIVRNEIAHLAAGGFRVNGGDDRSHPLLRTGDNVITDNHLHHFGEVFPSGVGVLIMHSNGNTVAHNHIHHGFYTGISVGWEWGYQRSVSRDNLIAYNHIHDIGQGLLSDMGGIYTLGVSPGTIIRGNRIHDVESHHYGGWGIYNDEGSTHHLVEKNIVYDTKFAPYNIHFAKEITVRDNVFAGGRIAQLSRSRIEPHRSVYFENNIVYWTEGELLDGRWDDEPYTFHFRPFGEGGTRSVESTFEMDYNLYFNPHLSRDDVRFGGLTWGEWRDRGKDVHSVYGDPHFVDPEQGDFRLKPGSPAFDLGFEPLETGKVGPRARK